MDEEEFLKFIEKMFKESLFGNEKKNKHNDKVLEKALEIENVTKIDFHLEAKLANGEKGLINVAFNKN
jgi:hypothetical protein